MTSLSANYMVFLIVFCGYLIGMLVFLGFYILRQYVVKRRQG